jgi:hypothetical protein
MKQAPEPGERRNNNDNYDWWTKYFASKEVILFTAEFSELLSKLVRANQLISC